MLITSVLDQQKEMVFMKKVIGDKSLIFDARGKLKPNQAGIHVLIAGVSNYPYLSDEESPVTLYKKNDKVEMRQLSSSAYTAYKLWEWLFKNQQKLSLPLATCRLLLSPSDEESRKIPSTVPSCELDNLTEAAHEWRKDTSSNKDNITIFYFAGHGLRRNSNDIVMLMQDFAKPNYSLLKFSVSSYAMRYGMAPSSVYTNIARTQFYFFDCCCGVVSEFRDIEKLDCSPLFDVNFDTTVDDRDALVSFATLPGAEAYQVKDEITLFGKALLKCLAGGAAVSKDKNGRTFWHISGESIQKVLKEHFNYLIDSPYQLQEPHFESVPRNSRTLVMLGDQRPLVDVQCKLIPQEVCYITNVEISNENGEPINFIINHNGDKVEKLPKPLLPHPYKCKIKAGLYNVAYNVDLPYEKRSVKAIEAANPPLSVWCKNLQEVV